MLAGNIAHRGARSLAPENTLLAFEKGWEIGADGVEVDVRALEDGSLIIFHDSSLERTTDVSHRFPHRVSAPVSTFSLDEIRTLDAGSWFLDQDPFSQIATGAVSSSELDSMAGLQIPTLDELLVFIKERGWRVNLELKRLPHSLAAIPFVAEVLARIKYYELSPDQLSISSFHHPYIDEVSERRPELEINALIGSKRSLRNKWGDYRYDIYNANEAYIDERQVHAARERGCTVNLYTVNDEEMMATYLSWGVNGLITDYPQKLKKLLGGPAHSDPAPPST